MRQQKMEAYAAEFDTKIAELRAFRDQHGHCNVPDLVPPATKRTPLRKWISRMREDYERMKNGKELYLTLERIAPLTELGLELSVGGTRQTFEERAAEWMAYRTKHGCEPKRDGGPSQSIAAWASKVRRKYEAKQQGKYSNLKYDQIQLLDK